PERAAGLRYRAAAAWFQKGQYDRAAELLDRVTHDEKAGRVRPRAALLEALSLQKVGGEERKQQAREAYLNALDRVISQFPKQREAQEARWWLGLARAEDGQVPLAIDLWSSIPPGSAHWLEGRLAIVGRRLAEIESSPATFSANEVAERLGTLRRFLEET